ncbi:MAG: 50S ribosomal protein L22 [Clostridia bacterium]
MAKRIREKAEKRIAEKDPRPFAKAMHVGISSSKVRIVLNTIRGQKVEDAIAILENLNNIAAEATLKVVSSAVANAEHNKGLNCEDLFVAEAYACPGPTLKRIMIRARGRADRILKRTSHITVVLDQKK